MTFEQYQFRLKERGFNPGGIDEDALRQAEADVPVLAKQFREAEDELKRARQHERKIFAQQNTINKQAKANASEFREAKRKALVAIVAESPDAGPLTAQAQSLLDRSRWLSDAIQLLAGSLQDEARIAVLQAEALLAHAGADLQMAEGVRKSIANWLALRPAFAQDPGLSINSGSVADQTIAEAMTLKVRANEATEKVEKLKRLTEAA
jgi:hypothetical protein